MSVTLMSASGRTLDIRIAPTATDSAASRAALRIANREHGSHGWRVLRVF